MLVQRNRKGRMNSTEDVAASAAMVPSFEQTERLVTTVGVAVRSAGIWLDSQLVKASDKKRREDSLASNNAILRFEHMSSTCHSSGRVARTKDERRKTG